MSLNDCLVLFHCRNLRSANDWSILLVECSAEHHGAVAKVVEPLPLPRRLNRAENGPFNGIVALLVFDVVKDEFWKFVAVQKWSNLCNTFTAGSDTEIGVFLNLFEAKFVAKTSVSDCWEVIAVLVVRRVFSRLLAVAWISDRHIALITCDFARCAFTNAITLVARPKKILLQRKTCEEMKRPRMMILEICAHHRSSDSVDEGSDQPSSIQHNKFGLARSTDCTDCTGISDSVEEPKSSYIA
uniref:Uncharacterized protein n=1 Tax=Ananas comosus var. bracteatus TaxID=296719 RepID=A0A6V7PLP1_ANACO|nr:unnamed protein product [Ananas comosus var. bracteatus]